MTGWVDSRMRTKNSDTPYMPDQFLDGIPLAIDAFFSNLSTWDGKDQSHPITSLASPTLLSKFASAHQQLASHGLSLSLSIARTISEPSIKDIFLTFGPKRVASTTLTDGTLLRRYNPASLAKRPNDSSIRQYILFREVIFEYAIREEDAEGWESHMPNLQQRAKTMKEGCCVGVDVSAEVELKIEVRKGGDGQGRLGEVVVSDSVKKPLEMRFETGHFLERMEGNWRVADVDRLITEERVLSEEKWKGRKAPLDDE
ncbi:hypothetical protein HDV00_000285 [Rhizophlyctis rosea]|nr:hypothetical protein HDV00_000285 [Rhizophlyctis rosea]